MQDYWLIRAGEGGSLWSNWENRENPVVTLGWDLGHPDEVPFGNKSELKDQIRDQYEDSDPVHTASQLRYFVGGRDTHVEEGDYVVILGKASVEAIGRVGELEYHPEGLEDNPSHTYWRPVEFLLKSSSPRSVRLKSLSPAYGQQDGENGDLSLYNLYRSIKRYDVSPDEFIGLVEELLSYNEFTVNKEQFSKDPLVEDLVTTIDRSYYLTLSDPVNFLTAYREETWGVRNTEDNSLDERWDELQEDDIVFFRSYRGPEDDKEWGIIGYGIVGPKKSEKSGYLWRDEHLKDELIYPLIFEFKHTEWIGNVAKIEPEPEHRKSDSQLENEVDALLEDMIPADEAADEMGHSSLMDINMSTISAESADALRSLIEQRQQDRQDRIVTGDLETIIPADELTKGLHFPSSMEARIQNEVNAALQGGKHIIFTGPPGTGKTELAKNVAGYLAAESDRITGHQITTGTADWSTFDTVGGYMPDTEQPNQLEFTPGQVLRRFKQDGRQQNELLVVDEINRADIDKAFGQLFTVLSGQNVQLPFQENGREVVIQSADGYDGYVRPHEYIVPNSWRILATMNVFDKNSLYEMSYAFMRRFTFIRIGVPDLTDPIDRLDLLKKYTSPTIWDLDIDDETLEAVGTIWNTINEAGRQIGPALIRDFVEHLAYYPDVDELTLTQTVINYLFPQLEGLPNREKIVTELGHLDELDQQRLFEAADEMLRTDLQTTTTSD